MAPIPVPFEVGFCGHKHYKSTNLLFVSDNQGIILFYSEPIEGQHHDTYDIKKHFKQILERAKQADIDLAHLFLNTDTTFDDTTFRRLLQQVDLEASIALNKRNSTISAREAYFDELLYKRRAAAEHPFAWMDAFSVKRSLWEKAYSSDMKP